MGRPYRPACEVARLAYPHGGRPMGEHGEGRKSPRSSGAQESLAGRRKIELSELLSELWSLPPPGGIPRLAIDNAIRSAGVDVPRAIVSTPAIQVHTHLLANGRFPAILPESVIHFSAKPMSVKMLPAVACNLALPNSFDMEYRTLGSRTLRDCARSLAALASTSSAPPG
jgi:DNA-binding transcriptional LysR family regulator